MIDHLTLKISDFEKAKAFYSAALRPLGYSVVMEFDKSAGLGAKKPDLWLAQDPDNVRPTHVAIAARDRAAVDAFHEAAIAAGGKDNGKPGVRADYHPTYYAAFVLDADGHNLEAVCHAPPRGRRAPARGAKKKAPARRPARRAGGARAKARGRR
jgi:catechol 2,3-dioxygenase-like lactoylglutathione lyase family enzyme